MAALRLLVLCALCATGSSCKRGDDLVAGFAESLEDFQQARCACLDVDCSEGGGLASECERDVVREHEDEIDDWLKCAIREVRAATECTRSLDCGDVDDGVCRFELDDVCGEIPERQSQEIEDEIERRCTKEIHCDDGSITQGGFCNGDVECDDGSDEAFCDDGDSGGGAVSEPGFLCDDGTFTSPTLTCDGVFDCPDGSDETGSAGCDSGAVLPPPTMMPPTLPPPPTTPETCVKLTPATPTFNPSCIQCVCSAAPDQAVACDGACWALIGCVLDFCPDAASGSSEQTECAVNECMSFLDGAGPAMALGPTIRETCSSVCPPF